MQKSQCSFRDEDIETFEQECLYVHDPETTEAERIQKILDTKYSPADLEQVAKECEELTKKEKERFQNLLEKFPELFYGSVGT